MLRHFKGKFLFTSESLLEEFTWLYLGNLLNLEPVKKQHIINKGNRLDILGVTRSGQLAILELKNGAGKAAIDQLIRYKDNLIKERPDTPEFSKVDFHQDFRMIAIASHFSAATIDYAHSRLPGCLLLTYNISKSLSADYYLNFSNLNNTLLSKVKIDILEDSVFDSLPSFIQGYLLACPDKREKILKIIDKILCYNSSISFETISNNYGTGIAKWMNFAKYNDQGKIINNKNCVLWIYEPETNFPLGKLSLRVYLPTVDFNPRKPVSKCWTKQVAEIFLETENFVNVTDLWDFNTMLCRGSNFHLRYPLKTPEIDETFTSFEDYYINYRKYMKSRKKLRPITHEDFTTVEGMVQMALEDWSVR